MADLLPSLKRRLACLLYEGLVVFSILLIGFLLPQVVLSGFGWRISPTGLWLHLFRLVLAEWRPDLADENLETARHQC